MKQFLIREFKDDTGNVYVDVEQLERMNV
ncbi:DUF1381 domain-containing protein [Staphylococcus epidermidis]